MKILLILPPKWSVNSPTLALPILSAVLKSKGHEVVVRDYNVEVYDRIKSKYDLRGNFELSKGRDEIVFDEEINKYISSMIKRDILSFQPDLIGFSVFTSAFSHFEFLLRFCQKFFSHIKIIAGGVALTNDVGQLLLKNNLLDAVVIGEGEDSVVELVEAFQNNNFSSPIPGVCFKKNDVIIMGESRKLIKIQNIPLPDFSDFDLDLYNHRGLPFMFSRGCVAKCNFCSEKYFWDKYRTLSAHDVYEWIKTLQVKYGVTRFFSFDSLVNGSHQILEDFCDLILASDLKIQWSGYCRLDKRLTNELVDKMARSGCVKLNFGVESGSERILDFMDKGTDISEAYRLIPLLKSYGIHVSIGIMVGYPQESENDFFETLNLIEDLKDSLGEVCTNLFNIPPNTPLFFTPEKYGIRLLEDGNWESLDGSNTLILRERRMAKLIACLEKNRIIYS